MATAEEWCDMFHAEQRVTARLRKENDYLRHQLTDLKELVAGWTHNMQRALRTYHSKPSQECDDSDFREVS